MKLSAKRQRELDADLDRVFSIGHCPNRDAQMGPSLPILVRRHVSPTTNMFGLLSYKTEKRYDFSPWFKGIA